MRRAPLTSLVTPLTLIAALLLLGNVVVFALWTAPRFSTRLGVAGGGGGVADARQRIDPALRLARDTYGRLGSADDDLDEFRARVIATVGGAELLGMLDGAGDGVGIDLDDATLQYVPLPELGVLQLGITFPVSGTYEAVRLLLDELTGLPVFLVVDGIGLQSFGGAGAAQTIRVDLAVSVFLDDREIAAPAAPAAPPRSVISPSDIEELRAAVRSDDPDEIADAVLAALTALPPLPVDPQALLVDLDRLDTTPSSTQPRRNLFSVVLPPEPEFEAADEPEIYVEPEPVLPLRLLGVLLIEGRWHASVTDELRVFIVEPGDSLPNGVDIIDVGKDYAEVTYRERTTVLNLEGNRP